MEFVLQIVVNHTNHPLLVSFTTLQILNLKIKFLDNHQYKAFLCMARQLLGKVGSSSNLICQQSWDGKINRLFLSPNLRRQQ
jgi:hypothetical protein